MQLGYSIICIVVQADQISHHPLSAPKVSKARTMTSEIKRKLAENRLTKPLFDTEVFTRYIEAAYRAMYDRYQVGLPPDHIVVCAEDI